MSSRSYFIAFLSDPSLTVNRLVFEKRLRQVQDLYLYCSTEKVVVENSREEQNKNSVDILSQREGVLLFDESEIRMTRDELADEGLFPHLLYVKLE
jgi:hypothetical protein